MLRTRTFSYSVEDISACDVDEEISACDVDEDISACDVDEDIVQAEADPETPLVSVTNR